MFFDSTGVFQHYTKGVTVTGHWKLSNKGKKLTMKYTDGKFRGKYKKPIDFENPFYQAEEHLELYNSPTDSANGGDSMYIRLSVKQAKEINVFKETKKLKWKTS